MKTHWLGSMWICLGVAWLASCSDGNVGSNAGSGESPAATAGPSGATSGGATSGGSGGSAASGASDGPSSTSGAGASDASGAGGAGGVATSGSGASGSSASGSSSSTSGSGGAASGLLSQAAAAMSPGDWVDFTMGGLQGDLLSAAGPSVPSLVVYAARAVWDPVHKKIQFAGTSHTGGQFIQDAGGLITWDDATNQWTKESYDWSSASPGHAYYHLTIDPESGDLYFRQYNSSETTRRSYGSTGQSSWQSGQVAGHPNNANQVAGGLEWFAELNGGSGGLVFVDLLGASWSNAALSSWQSQNPNGTDLLLFATSPGGLLARFDGTSWSNIGTTEVGPQFWVGVTIADYGVVVFIGHPSGTGTPYARVFKP